MWGVIEPYAIHGFIVEPSQVKKTAIGAYSIISKPPV
jgi:hypothetical protein